MLSILLVITIFFLCIPSVSALWTFRVIDVDGEYIEGAKVELASGVAYTNDNGIATFDVAPGEYNLTIIRSGYKPHNSQVTLTENGNSEIILQRGMEAQTGLIALAIFIMGMIASVSIIPKDFKYLGVLLSILIPLLLLASEVVI